MFIHPRALEKLRCTSCKGVLTVNEPVEALDCEACRLRFGVAEGIPNMLLDDASSMDEPAGMSDGEAP